MANQRGVGLDIGTMNLVSARRSGKAIDTRRMRDAFLDLPDLERCDVEPLDGDFHRVALTPRNGTDLRPAVFELVRTHQWTLRELTRRHHSLEDIFVHLTRTKKDVE